MSSAGACINKSLHMPMCMRNCVRDAFDSCRQLSHSRVLLYILLDHGVVLVKCTRSCLGGVAAAAAGTNTSAEVASGAVCMVALRLLGSGGVDSRRLMCCCSELLPSTRLCCSVLLARDHLRQHYAVSLCDEVDSADAIVHHCLTRLHWDSCRSLPRHCGDSTDPQHGQPFG